MKIVRAEITDIDYIMEIIIACVKDMESKGIFQWNEHYPDSSVIIEDIGSQSAYLLVEEDACFAYVSINEVQPEEYKTIKWNENTGKILVVHRLSVHPDRQGRGAARGLMEFIQKYAVENDYSFIRLDAYSKNPAALNLYEKSGFRKMGEGYFPFREHPFYFFEKSLII